MTTLNKIVFFGSGPVAAESLRLLLSQFEIEAVITKPATENEMRALVGNIPVYTAKDGDQLDEVIKNNSFSSNVGVLIDFGIIVSRYVIDAFDLGIINSHFSLLPEWRGADPITFSILSGQSETGVSLMLLVEAMDEGPLLTYGEYEIAPDMTTPGLTKELIKLSNSLLLENVPLYLSGKLNTTSQVVTGKSLSYSRKLAKQDGLLDFTKPAKVLEREIRAFIEWPKSRTQLAGKDVIILSAKVIESADGTPGEIFRSNERKIGIYTDKGALLIETLKPAGKSEMTAEAFLAGYGNKL